MPAALPDISVIIPHWRGHGLLTGCLDALEKTRYPSFQVIIVDNGCDDGSIQEAEGRRGTVIVRSGTNLGFASGCNLGIRCARTPYVVLLNNDAEPEPDWLAPLVTLAESDPAIAAVQPKILDFYRRDRFDYSGGAGGEIDILGYPFARGRLFGHLEEDHGQYDRSAPLFWASGAASLYRTAAVREAGFLEDDFFAHMEEIDLCWRLQRAGYRIMSQPVSRVYHQSGGTLGSDSYRKMVLNHRNNLLMLLRNLSLPALVLLFPVRLLFEAVTIVASLVTLDFKRAAAVVSGFIGACRMPKTIARGRKGPAPAGCNERVILRRMYRGSIVVACFFKRLRSAGQLGY
ncbi:glycosyltransferase family 2 protein [bacterium]|nr:glycosyltransferase family 2 protein [bacterium]